MKTPIKSGQASGHRNNLGRPVRRIQDESSSDDDDDFQSVLSVPRSNNTSRSSEDTFVTAIRQNVNSKGPSNGKSVQNQNGPKRVEKRVPPPLILPPFLPTENSHDNWTFCRIYSQEIFEVYQKHMRKFDGKYLSRLLVGEVFYERVSEEGTDFDQSVFFQAVQVRKISQVFKFGKDQRRIRVDCVEVPTAENAALEESVKSRKLIATSSLAGLIESFIREDDVLLLFGDILIEGAKVIVLNSRQRHPLTIAHYRHDGIFNPEDEMKEPVSQLRKTSSNPNFCHCFHVFGKNEVRYHVEPNKSHRKERILQPSDFMSTGHADLDEVIANDISLNDADVVAMATAEGSALAADGRRPEGSRSRSEIRVTTERESALATKTRATTEPGSTLATKTRTTAEPGSTLATKTRTTAEPVSALATQIRAANESKSAAKPRSAFTEPASSTSTTPRTSNEPRSCFTLKIRPPQPRAASNSRSRTIDFRTATKSPSPAAPETRVISKSRSPLAPDTLVTSKSRPATTETRLVAVHTASPFKSPTKGSPEPSKSTGTKDLTPPTAGQKPASRSKHHHHHNNTPTSSKKPNGRCPPSPPLVSQVPGRDSSPELFPLSDDESDAEPEKNNQKDDSSSVISVDIAHAIDEGALEDENDSDWAPSKAKKFKRIESSSSPERRNQRLGSIKASALPKQKDPKARSPQRPHSVHQQQGEQPRSHRQSISPQKKQNSESRSHQSRSQRPVSSSKHVNGSNNSLTKDCYVRMERIPPAKLSAILARKKTSKKSSRLSTSSSE